MFLDVGVLRFRRAPPGARVLRLRHDALENVYVGGDTVLFQIDVFQVGDLLEFGALVVVSRQPGVIFVVIPERKPLTSSTL